MYRRNYNRARKRKLSESAYHNMLEDELESLSDWVHNKYRRDSVLSGKDLEQVNEKLEDILEIIYEAQTDFVTNEIQDGVYDLLEVIEEVSHRIPEELGGNDLKAFLNVIEGMVEFIKGAKR